MSAICAACYGNCNRAAKPSEWNSRLITRIRVPFEEDIAAERLSGEDVLLELDCAAYFDLLGVPAADGRDATLEALEHDRLIAPDNAGGFNITNLGAILLAKDLGSFPRLRRKALRVIEYRGRDRLETLREREGTKGYAAGFAELMDYLHARLPTHEENGRAFQRSVPEFPPLAVRELVANALIHQDFSVTGAGPTVEIFEGRVEITNPGEPLTKPERFLDSQPISRNEALASLMRRFDICEERGSSIDKVVAEVERLQLPAPIFEMPPGCTRTVLFGPKPLAEMDRSERVRACYLHACLKHVNREPFTNASVRKRFDIKAATAASVASIASRYIREAVEAGYIKPLDEQAGRRRMSYVPFWAASELARPHLTGTTENEHDLP